MFTQRLDKPVCAYVKRETISSRGAGVDAAIGHNSFVTTPRPFWVRVLAVEGQMQIANRYLRCALPEQYLGSKRHVLRVRDELKLDRGPVTRP